jgi:acetoacetate decarboxylase
MPRLAPINKDKAKEIFAEHSAFRGEFDFAISVREGETIHGVIALNADGDRFSLAHLYTDANAQIGTLLYGAAWRAAKAMGYQCVWI